MMWKTLNEGKGLDVGDTALLIGPMVEVLKPESVNDDVLAA